MAMMNAELRLRKLEDGLKNAHERNVVLAEIVRTLNVTEKSSHNLDLHRKMDQILENQSKMEQKFENLKGNVVLEVKNSAEIKHIIDAVDTSIAHLQRFIRNFGKIHTEIQEMEARCSVKFDELSEKLQEEITKSENATNGYSNLGGKLDNLERKLANFSTNQPNHDNLIAKMNTFQADYSNGKTEMLSINLNRFHSVEEKIDDLGRRLDSITENMKKNECRSQKMEPTNLNTKTKHTPEIVNTHEIRIPVHDQAPQTINSQIPAVHQEIGLSVDQTLSANTLKDVFRFIPEAVIVNRKCRVDSCNAVLSKNLKRREDDASVKCPVCRRYNIVSTLQKGQKWMDVGGHLHFQQFPVYKKEGDKEKCRICGVIGTIKDAGHMMAI